jgi:hypothetical protein
VQSMMRGREEGSARKGRREMIMRQPAGVTRQNERRHDKMTRRREGGASRGDAHNNQPAQQEDEERQCDNKLAVALIWKPAKSCIRCRPQ